MSKSFANLSQLFSNAYQWLCKSRKNHPPDSDIWSLVYGVNDSQPNLTACKYSIN